LSVWCGREVQIVSSGMDPAEALAIPVESEPALAGELFGPEIGAARRYVEMLADGGIVRGLIGPRERGRLWTRHVVNSALGAALLPADGTVVDIGSGAGLPGIPMAIARPDVLITLVEPLERRVVFLAEVIDELGLTNCRVLRGRADQVVADAGGADVVTSRAVAPLARLAGWSAPLLRAGGELMALKGSSAADEVERDAAVVAGLGLRELRVEVLGADVTDEPTYLIRGVFRPVSRQRARSGR
jgi:16S rRNA (guanine527-N7)-methyltransferase